MPVNRQHDILLHSRGYMLARPGKGRAWWRTGRSDAPGVRSSEDARWSGLEDTIDHAEVWNDWSGGYGEPYRAPGSNQYDWAENCDTRFPGTWIHAQAFDWIQGDTSLSINSNGMLVEDVPVATNNAFHPPPATSVILIENDSGIQFIEPRSEREPNGFWAQYASLKADALGKPVGRGAIFGSFYYIPNSSTVSGFYRTDLVGAAGTPQPVGTGAPSNLIGHGFAVAGGLLWRFWNINADRQCVLQGCADPDRTFTAPAWTFTYYLPNRYAGARDMIGYEDQIFIGASDGLYAGDASGTFVNVTPGLGQGLADENYRTLAVHNGEIVFPHSSGLYAYDPVNGGTRDISPTSIKPGRFLSPWRAVGTTGGVGIGGRGKGVPPPRGEGGTSGTTSPIPITSGVPSRIVGRFRGIHSYAGWLYVGVVTGSGYSHVVAGREGGDGWIWHPMQRLPGVTRIRKLHVDSAGYGSGNLTMPVRIWALTDGSVGNGLTGSSHLFFHRIPNQNGSPLLGDTTFSPYYSGSARLDLGATDWGAPGTTKMYRVVEVWADSLASGCQYCDVYYTIDRSASAGYLGRAQASPKSALYFTASANSFVTGQSIALSLQSFTASPGVTPLYRSIVLRGALRARSVDSITAQVRIADNLRDRQGGTLRRGAAMLAELRALAVGAQPVQLVDLAGATSWVAVMPPVEEQEMYQAGELEPEIMATLKMAVLEFTGA